MQVDGVLAGDNVGDGRALLLAGGLDVGHFFNLLVSAGSEVSQSENSLNKASVVGEVIKSSTVEEKNSQVFFSGRNSFVGLA